jgi:hypothetical protein
MYLDAREFVSGYSHSSDSEKDRYTLAVTAAGLRNTDIDEMRYATINVNIGYWRKANHIHNWFVNNVQDGTDDCKPYYVSREQLTELRDLCMKVCKSGEPEVAEELLPTGVGFFFGSTEYEEYYFEETDRTARMLSMILDNERMTGMDFYYTSSW